ncbi:NEW3 domain-containing protein [Bacillus songklensis]|uniref:NEW3 domain-containing protein n=1 Tax=Bacillus songklensis TaxID=1069116 RepID=A0ABV8B1A1_9BACI
MRKIFTFILSFLIIFGLVSPQVALGEGEPANRTPPIELWNALKPLSTTVSFMNTGAHPDDERSDLLAYLSRGLGVRTSSIIANRGEGGQNEIGTELGNALGMIRSRELIEASKVTDVQVYHLSEKPSDEIYDFGFSKSKEETLSKWGEEVTYERFIRLLRQQRPDIVMPSFLDVDTEHGHHRTMNMLTLKAFKDAADSNVFPEHLKEGLHPWQIKKLYLPAKQDNATVSFDIGIYDEKYGMTYPQLGEASRYLHKSQGMGRDIPAEPRMIYLKLEKANDLPLTKEKSIFKGIPYDFEQYADQFRHIPHLSAHLTQLQRDLQELIDFYPNDTKVADKTPKALKQLKHTVQIVKESRLGNEEKYDLLYRLEIKEEQLMKVMQVASKLSMKVEIDNPTLTKDGTAKVKVTVQNEGGKALRDTEFSLQVPEEWSVSEKASKNVLKQNESFVHVFTLRVPKDASYHQPYHPETVTASLHYKADGQSFTAAKRPQQTVAVLPEVSLQVKNENMVLNTKEIKDQYNVEVIARNYQTGKANAKVSLQVPDGWKVKQNNILVPFGKQFEEKNVTFEVIPPKTVNEGKGTFKAVASINGKELSTTVQTIQYDHIGTDYYLYDSAVKVVAFPLEFDKGLKIGYIQSGFDSVGDELKAIGMNITNLSEQDLASGDLSQYDTIVLGIRAYLSREDLRTHNSKLLEYVHRGGHLVVQYHKPEDYWDAEATPPYKLIIGSPSIKVRVTDENANVTVLKPEHVLFNSPNKITEKDWNGWVQERGLYFPTEWNESEYQTFVSMADPNETPFNSGVLLAHYGKGSYLYTNLVWYRQIQNQVPGGYRIFTNLLHYGANQN